MKDILKFRTCEHKVKILSGQPSAFRSKDITRTGARVFTPDGLVSSTAQIGDVSDGVLIEKCQSNRDAAMPAEGVPTGSQKQTWDCSWLKGSASDLALQTAQTHTQQISKRLPHFVVQGQVTVSSKSLAYKNDLGADLQLLIDELSFMYELRRKGSPNVADGFVFHSDLTSEIIPDDLDWTLGLYETFDVNAPIKPGRHKILMLPDETALAKVSESLRADSYKEGTALYSGRLGERIFGEKFSVSDLRSDPKRGALSPFDCEGSLATGPKTALIEKGTLRHLISDLRNQKRHAVATTANGFRGFNSSVKLGFSQLSVEPGSRSHQEVLRDAGDVIVCVMAFGGDLTAQGDFSMPIQMAFLSRNGQIVGKLPALSMSSHIEKMFGADLLEVAATGPHRHSPQPYLLCEMDVQVI